MLNIPTREFAVKPERPVNNERSGHKWYREKTLIRLVSRDIRELKLTKVLTGRGSYRYTLSSVEEREPGFRFNSVLVESIKKVDFAGNIVVLKTFPGLAQAVATGLDAIDSHDILGCVAGDDCIILVARTHDAAKDISERIKTILKSI